MCCDLRSSFRYAIPKTHVGMYDFNYFELLSMHQLDGKWVIVNKMVSDVGW